MGEFFDTVVAEQGERAVRGFTSLEEHIRQWRLQSQQPAQRTPLGLPTVDQAIRGIAAGEVCTVIARSGVGKSIVATHAMAQNPHVPIIFISLEMPAVQVMQRLYAQVTDSPAADVVLATMSNQLWPDIEALAEKVPLHVVIDTPGVRLNEATAYVENYDTYFGQRPKLVIFDYLELIGGLKSSGQTSAETVAALADQLKQWAKDQQLGVLVLHQMNMGREAWEEPTRSSARYGGVTESDFVIGMWQPGLDPDVRVPHGITEVFFSVIKNRTFGDEPRGLRYSLTPSLRLVPLS